MSDWISITDGALVIDARLAGAGTGTGTVVPLGVAVELHPGVARELRMFVLETALRVWANSHPDGSLVRGGKPPDETWLPGWTLTWRGQTVVGLRIAYRDDAEGGEESGEAAR